MIQPASTLDDLRLQPHWSYSAINQFLRICPAQFAFQRVWGLKPARLQYWLDLNNVLSPNCWNARPAFLEGTDRPAPLVHLLNGGEAHAKLALRGKA